MWNNKKTILNQRNNHSEKQGKELRYTVIATFSCVGLCDLKILVWSLVCQLDIKVLLATHVIQIIWYRCH